jgi:prolipoprotein diacylglyceryltransferase
MKSILLESANGTGYFALFYVLAFLTALIILVVQGRQKKLPTLPWLIVIATGFIFFVVGCHVFTLSSEDWSNILNNRPLFHESGLTMLGGLLLSVPAILIARRLAGLNESAIDAYAFVLPICMCIQRLGCFLKGCCFGTVTQGWGICYGPGTSPYQHTRRSGSRLLHKVAPLEIHLPVALRHPGVHYPDIIVFHQVNPDIVKILRKLFSSKQCEVVDFSEIVGNCGAASFGIAMNMIQDKLNHEKVFLCSFGTGGVISAGLWQF